ncbi:dapdiamide synthesis protein DdaC-like isoform X1 [Oculina patagonica]
MITKSRVLTAFWRFSPGLPGRPNRTLSTATASICEQIPREELVTKFKSRLRDRQFLPGSSGGGFPEFLAEPRDSFPLGVRVNNRNQSSLAELTEKCMHYVRENFSRSPAILFRGLPAETAGDFSVITQATQEKALTYEGGTALRSQVDTRAGTYTASNEPSCFSIELHNEMAYSDVFPSKVMFFCLKEPDDGGETPLAKNSEILTKLDPEVVQKFEEKQVQYVRYLPDKSHREYQNWQVVFRTERREDVEARAKQQGYKLRWDESGDLHLSLVKPAFIPHPVTGERTWFNAICNNNNTNAKAMPRFIGKDVPDDKLPRHSFYGDGSEIEPEVLQHMRATAWSCAVGFRWQRGDLLVLDNLAVLHARLGFTGDRKILVYLTA